jgi:Cu2+-exporting ATPase
MSSVTSALAADSTTESAVARACPPALGESLDDPVAQATFTEWQACSDGRREARSRLRVTGMYCAACAGIVERALADAAGVLDARVNAATARLALTWDPAQAQLSSLAAAVQAAGYGIVPDAAAPAREVRQREQRQALWRLFVSAFCMMQVMMLATPIYFAAPGEMAADQRQLLNWGAWMFSIPVLLFAAGPFFAGAWQQLRQRRVGMDVPVSLALAVTFVASTGAAFEPGGLFGSEVYFDSLTMFVCFLLAARTLEQRARHRVISTLEDTIERLPSGAQRLSEAGAVDMVAPAELRRGDRVRVPAGAVFPADGVIIEGLTLADEALLSGESEPQRKACGAQVVAGSVNIDAPVVMRVERVGAETRYEAIVALMREALVQRPRLLRAADRIAGPFLWVVLLLAAGSAAVWSVIDPSRAVWVAVSVLVVTCPCALSLAAPSALLAAAGSLARRGVLLQRLDAIEALARMQRLFIDKTGTLTDDRVELAAVQDVAGTPLEPSAASRALQLAASLAAWSNHPLSRSLVAAAGGDPPHRPWQDVQEHPGLGLSARLDGVAVRLGRRDWVLLAASEAALGPVDDDKNGLCAWFVREDAPVVQFRLQETLREGARDAIETLERDGVRVNLLSGDRPQRVAAVASRLGITEARGGASPQDKVDAVAAAQARGEVVGMLGDGINDAPVLARADVALAMGQAALISRQRADGVVLSMRLDDVATAREVARHAVRVIRQNLGWAIGYNLVCIPLALGGWLPPWLAGLGMALSSLTVVLNAQRLSRC